MYGGRITKNKQGKDTILLEMKGSACRDFEERGFTSSIYNGEYIESRAELNRRIWIDLIETCLDLNGHCTRIDVPVDDFTGVITIDEIKEKVKNREYVTKMRHLEITDEEKVNNEFYEETENFLKNNIAGIPTIVDSKLSGYSATFGGRKSTQLCIYNKKAEQEAKGFNVELPSWIRYETRYYHQNAEEEIERLLKALKEKNEVKHIASCLATSIEFKEMNKLGDRNKYKATKRYKWENFLKNIAKNDSFSKYNKACSIDTNVAWIIKSASKAAIRIITSKPIEPEDLLYVFCNESLKRINETDLLMINESRRKYQIIEFETLNDLKGYIKEIKDKYKEPNSLSMEVFYGQKVYRREE